MNHFDLIRQEADRISEKRIIDRDEHLGTDWFPAKRPAQCDIPDCRGRVVWRRRYVGGEHAYFCDEHMDVPEEHRGAAAERYEGSVHSIGAPAPTARDLAWQAWAGHGTGNSFDAGYDAALALAAPLAEALRDCAAEASLTADPWAHLDRVRRLAEQCLAAYKAAVG
jgi:hypothetical protein